MCCKENIGGLVAASGVEGEFAEEPGGGAVLRSVQSESLRLPARGTDGAAVSSQARLAVEGVGVRGAARLAH